MFGTTILHNLQGHSLHIYCEKSSRKTRTRNNSAFGHFLHNDPLFYVSFKDIFWISLLNFFWQVSIVWVHGSLGFIDH